MNSTGKLDNLNPQVAFINDTELRNGSFYKIKATEAVAFTIFAKNASTLDGLVDTTIDMSTIGMAAGDEIVVNFHTIQLASGSALIYSAEIPRTYNYAE